MTDETVSPASTGRAVINGIWMFAGSRPIRSVLICDDRPAMLHGLLNLLRPLPSLVDIAWVTDGFALVDAVAAQPVDLVLVGIHRTNAAGAEAVNLLLEMHPTSVIIVFGSISDIDILAAAFVNGARGMLPWGPREMTTLDDAAHDIVSGTLSPYRLTLRH